MGGGPGPYLPTRQMPNSQLRQPQQSTTLGSESVRAAGSGPFDSAYRQNLATFAGGLFQRPGGNLSFNPTGNNLFGNPTGGGNAPVQGMPNSLTDMAMGGQPFSAPQPQQASPNTSEPWKFWLNQFGDNGKLLFTGSGML